MHEIVVFQFVLFHQKRKQTSRDGNNIWLTVSKFLNLNFFKGVMRFDFKHILIINTWIDWYWCGKLYCKSPIRKKIRDEFLTFYVQNKKLAVNSASAGTNPFEICCDFCFPGTLWCLDGRNTITLVNYAHDDYKFLDLYSFLKYMILLFLG